MMKKMFALALLLCLFALPALAEECDHTFGDDNKCTNTDCGVTGGYCGADTNEGGKESVIWTLDNGAFTVSGTGAMADYDSGNKRPWYADRGNITSVTIHEGVTSIAAHAFRECTWLTSIVISASVETLGDNAFYACSEIKNVTFAEGSGLITIGAGAFRSCFALKSITIPASVETLGNEAFRSCDSLETVTFAEGSGLTTIGAWAFWGCSQLKQITIPDSVTGIVEGAFLNSGLTTVYAPCSWNETPLYDFGEGVTVISHKWSYAAAGATITERCGNGCNMDGSVGGSVTLIPPEPCVYDGAQKIVTVKAEPPFVNPIVTVPGVAYTGDRVSAGTFTASLTVGGATATLPVTIAKADTAVTAAPTANTLTYTGSAQALVTKGEATTGGTLVYSLNQTDWSAEIPTAIAVGDYTVYYKVVGDANHNDTAVYGPVNVTIAYLPGEQAPDAVPSGKKNDADCYAEQPTLTAPEGTKVSLSDSADAQWSDELPLPTEDGTHTYTYYIKDENGLIAKKTVTLTVDTTPPQVPDTGILVDPTTATIIAPATDEGSGVMDCKLTVNSGKGELVIEGNGDGSYTITGLIPGETYEFTLTVRDYAGHETKVDITITAPLPPALPQTGDNSAPLLWLTLMTLAGAAMLTLAGAAMLTLRRKAEQ